MHIKKLILDGFKSYANRTVVDGFDTEFNAITGLNGSGKSNILDSICFVLGITNLSQVRAKSLQELVYKNGQAGVTKATVSIVFDNTNKEQSPIGYADHDEITVTRQVVIGGKNKYLINGHNAQKNRVENFFHSVQLNVNNPHFLIMQGRITKVLNMKPPEILSMIEEAAGTRMYETKKAGSLQVMEKKEQKMIEIERMLQEEIQPTLEKLRKERAAFFEWQKNGMEIEHLNRLVTAHMYMQAEEFLNQAKEEMESLEAREQELATSMEKANRECANLQQNVGIMEKKKAAELSGGLKDMEHQANELSKGVVKATEKWKGKKADREAEEKNKLDALGNITDLEKSVKKQHTEIEKAKGKHESLVEVHKASEEEVEKQEKRHHAVSMGMSEEDGASKTFTEQIQDAKTEAVAMKTEVEAAKMRIKHQTPALQEKRKAAKGSEKEHATLTAALTKDSKEIERIAAAMSKLDFDEEKETALETQKVAIDEEMGTLRDVTDRLGAKLGRLDFNYSNPEPNFDRSKVKGLVAQLISVKKPEAMCALEVSAGGKLYNVVVDDEVTGKKLLKNGKLKRRVTIIPLNKIRPRKIDPATVKHAEKAVGAANVDTALSLVGYDAEVKTAMQYVFGGNFVCPDMDMAKKVTFNDKIRTKSVTLDGDVMDPSGTLTGGARQNSTPILAMLHEYNKAKSRLKKLGDQLAGIDKELTALRKDSAKYNKLKEQRELKTHEIELARSRIKQSSCGQIMQEVTELESALEASKKALADCASREKEAVKKVTTIEKEMDKAQKEQENKLKEVDKAIANAQKKRIQAKSNMNKGKLASEEKVLELEALEAELGAAKEQITGFGDVIAKLKADEDALGEVLAGEKEAFEETSKELGNRQEKVAACEKEIHALRVKINLLTKEQQEGTIELKTLKNKISGFEKKKKDAAQRVASLVREHPWITEERHLFGKVDTAYEFKKGDPEKDPTKCAKRLQQLVEAQDKLSKNVNMKVMSMFDKTEKSATDLLRRKKIVEADRAKIAHAIEELDEKKNEALKKAYTRVNKDFGSIFSTLLPGTRAQLATLEGKDVLAGLQVRIAFGDIWKESLTELSGGQRSLVALSLILSLLLFKPAPLYILDEIDAALDLSHTQNIGQMLKAHFKQSQFVVVSLKEGMFNNANVLFKTAFVDGVSTVRRTAQSSKAKAIDGKASRTKENVRPRGKAAAGSRARSKLSTVN